MILQCPLTIVSFARVPGQTIYGQTVYGQTLEGQTVEGQTVYGTKGI